ncbi:ABC transporter substrate-binding protein [Candidatus Terasakiella magnetica]|nr:ABC transporter substrate binding protein [Candidatus Terasakiella magnetica]
MVHSQLGLPYEGFSTPFIHEVKKTHKKLQIDHINLENHEKHLVRSLIKTDYTNICAVVAVGTIALRAVRDQKILPSTLPVIFGVVTDPVGEKVIEGFNVKPKGRFTGVSFSIDIKERLRFMRQTFPDAKNIGVIYSTMPQSLSYKKWLVNLEHDLEFKDLNFIYRRVGMITKQDGPYKMIKRAERPILALKDQVDLFISPSDQMGILPQFAQAVVKLTNKPVFGLAQKDVEIEMGAVASAYPDIKNSAIIAAKMMTGILKGKAVSNYPPQRPRAVNLINKKTAKAFKIKG